MLYKIILKDILNFGTYDSLVLELNGRKYSYKLHQSYHNGKKNVNTRDNKEKNYFIYDETSNHNFDSLYDLQPVFDHYRGDILKLLKDKHTIIIKMTRDGSFQKLMDIEEYPEKNEHFNYTVNHNSYIENE